jgi:hypothetical protein
MNCVGSIALLKRLSIPEDTDDPSYRKEGTAMHTVGERCLTNGSDAWEAVNCTVEGVLIDKAMALSVQQYVDYVLPLAQDAKKFYVEHRVTSAEHPQFFGTLDFAAVSKDRVDVVDLKGGKGIIVEPEENPQLMYYAYGLLEAHSEIDDDCLVFLTVVQPRGWHAQGPIRTWETTAGYIRKWAAETLFPAMRDADKGGSLTPGEWCRFCPAKLVCPALGAIARAAATAAPASISRLTDAALAQEYAALAAVRFYTKAVEDELFTRLNGGAVVEGVKLVAKKANRVWNDDAEGELAKTFGDEAFTQPTIKSPPQIEALGPKGQAFVRQHAYTPQAGFTVAPATDRRQGVQVRTPSAVFKDKIKAA